MSNCCCTGTGTGTANCCCPSPTDSYSILFSGITNGTDLGCTSFNTKVCLCYQSCGLYTGTILARNLQTISTLYFELSFDCAATPTGSGSGTGTAPYPGSVRLRIYNFNAFGGVIATYEKSRHSWHCQGDTTLALISATSSCKWPAYVTVKKDTSSVVCKCSCGGGLNVIGRAITYTLIIGDMATGTCPKGDCGCDTPETRICLSQAGPCIWSGVWYPITQTGDVVTALTIPSGGSPDECNIAWPTKTYHTAILYFDSLTNLMTLVWGYGTDSNGNIITPIAKYTLSADSFDPTGNNIFSYVSGSYAACTLPSTVKINYNSDDNQSCYDPTFRCQVCNQISILYSGWTFTIAGVSGPTHSYDCFIPGFNDPADREAFRGTVRPCTALNGDYCIGYTGSGCTWDSGHGTVPTQVYYKTITGDNTICGGGFTSGNQPIPNTNPAAVVRAYMGIQGGVVGIQLIIDYLVFYNYFTGAYISKSGTCTLSLFYEMAASNFNCNGSNTLTLKCSEQLNLLANSDNPSDGSCSCTSIPSTITITPTNACGTPPPPIVCGCIPKSNYTPRILITGIGNGSCIDCCCLSSLDLCFSATGNANQCTWRCDFTLPSNTPIDCKTAATYALLTIALAPNEHSVILGIYNSSNTLLAQFSNSYTGFNCDIGNFPLYYNSASDVCTWSGASATLNMHGGSCPTTCSPCTIAQVISGSNGVYLFGNWDVYSMEFCITVPISSCRAQSSNVVVNGVTLYAIIEFGAVPSRFVRVLIYVDHITGTGADQLIGVYNYLPDPSNFSCVYTGPSSINELSLATGNAGQCGYDIDVGGYTSHLGSLLRYEGLTACPTPPCVPASYTTPGTYSFVSVSGVIYTIECWGGGGGGKGGTADNRNGAGAGGAYSKITWTGDGSTVTVTVGSGGAAGFNADGATGGDSSFGAICVAKGGQGGNASAVNPCSTGGQASAGTGTTKYSGGGGGSGEGGSGTGGAGGSSAGVASNGNNGQSGDGAISDTIGGAAVTGGGAGGNGGYATVGQPGGFPGGGGGSGDNGTGSVGAAGGNGQVLVSC